MEHYLAIKSNEVQIQETSMNLENKKARHKRPPIALFHLYEMSKVSKSIQTKSVISGCQGLRESRHGK
jgi:hypothetical protein